MSFQELGSVASAGPHEKPVSGRSLDDPTLMQEQDLVAKPARLAEVVSDHDDLGTGRMQRGDDALDLLCRTRVEARGRFIEKQKLGAQRPHARQRKPLLFAAGKHARRSTGERIQADACAAPRVRGPRAAAMGAPAIRNAWTTLASAERRSRTGLWKTIAWRRGACGSSGAFQRIVPALGCRRPWHSRNRTLFPAPFGPTIMVRISASSVSVTPSMMRRPPAAKTTSRNCSGSSVMAGCTRGPPSSISALRHLSDDKGGGVECEDDRQQDATETESKRQVPFARFQRDRCGHDARDAVDVAADDDDRADLTGGASKPRQHDRDQRKTQIPEQRNRGAKPRLAQRAQLLAIFDPRILDAPAATAPRRSV